MALPGCKDCGKSMLGSHTIAVYDKRCDSCYMKRQRRFGNSYFCSNCLSAASGDTGKSYSLNGGLCEDCFHRRSGKVIADEAYIKGRHGGGGSSSGGCFITTATLVAIGKGDHCEELETFRSYRDNILLNESDGKKLIREYYEKAPKIVNKIDSSKNRKELYESIWFDQLQFCYKLIKQGKHEKAKTAYISLIKNLESKYL